MTLTTPSTSIPHVRFVTVLRDPVQQELSFESFMLNYKYFRNYPKHPCADSKHVDIHQHMSTKELNMRLDSVSRCQDTPYRINLTLLYTATKIRDLKKRRPGKGVQSTYQWITMNKWVISTPAHRILEILRTDFFLVGVIEYLNQFLVLLALVYHWDLSAMYYRRCKQSDLRVTTEQFQEMYPTFSAKLETHNSVYKEVYEQIKKDFETNIQLLGPWFQEKVRQFEQGLAQYQHEIENPNENSFQWKLMKYADGSVEEC